MTAPRLVALAGLFAACFVAIAIVVASGRSPIDLEVATWMAAHRDAPGTDLFLAIAYLGSVVGLVPLGLLVAAYLQRRMGWKPVRWLALAMFGATAIYAVINVLFHSARPPLSLRAMDEVGYSFPSGHSTQAITFWTVVPVLVGADRSARVQRSLHALGAILVVLTAGSRIYLGVHWTFDVLGGLSLGGFWTCCVLALRGSNER